MNIYSVGATPEVAIRVLCDTRFGKLDGPLTPLAKYRGRTYEWGYRFTANGKTRMAAGIFVHGGAVCTFWR